jgi:hypothetical protein
MTTMCSWVMCATAGAAGAAGAAGLELLDCCWGYLLRLVMFGGAAGQWAGVGAAMSAGSRSLPAHYTHYTGPWAAEKAPGQAAAATYMTIATIHHLGSSIHCWLMLPRLVHIQPPLPTTRVPLCFTLTLAAPRVRGQQLPERASLFACRQFGHAPVDG